MLGKYNGRRFAGEYKMLRLKIGLEQFQSCSGGIGNHGLEFVVYRIGLVLRQAMGSREHHQFQSGVETFLVRRMVFILVHMVISIFPALVAILGHELQH